MNLETDFTRQLYCIGGLPFDSVTLSQTTELIFQSIHENRKLFLTTPNLNFMIACQHDDDFRQSVIESDLVIADGFPIVLIAKMLGIPIPERVAGSTVFEQMRQDTRKWSVYFFGGPEGVAKQASAVVGTKGSVIAVGDYYPGFASVDEMSSSEVIDKINVASPDFLVIALGARKGQLWIQKNIEQLNTRVVSHLGAVVNFVAGTVLRAPAWVQKCGLEWLWRIKEEPALWRRYMHDGVGFLSLLSFSVFPLMALNWLIKLLTPQIQPQIIEHYIDQQWVRLQCRGRFDGGVNKEIRRCLQHVAERNLSVELDLSETSFLGASFLALLIIFHKHLSAKRQTLRITNVPWVLNLQLKFNSLSYLPIKKG